MGSETWKAVPGLRSHRSEQLPRHSRPRLALQLQPGAVTDLSALLPLILYFHTIHTSN